jgi:1,2-phenylacetyl-CoA epoxidase catalytic subunit
MVVCTLRGEEDMVDLEMITMDMVVEVDMGEGVMTSGVVNDFTMKRRSRTLTMLRHQQEKLHHLLHLPVYHHLLRLQVHLI